MGKAWDIIIVVFIFNLAVTGISSVCDYFEIPFSNQSFVPTGSSDLVNQFDNTSESAPNQVTESSLFGDWAWAVSIVGTLFGFLTGNYNIWLSLGVDPLFAQFLRVVCMMANGFALLEIISKVKV
ncbi:hypothetical protein [Methanococcus maripaludis]|uniref:Uncharacterized protein n=1 Tax=Methanococcus maripaludis TaxID=39152 RepID=A0A2L1C8G6_METMI|nr:hypothetical protein [Methanococcus maripaludis]AVB75645.1 hypothetical protein MMJJ_02260 [Methanococcus maripaludis]